MGGIATVSGANARRVGALRRTLMHRGYDVVAIGWPPDDLIAACDDLRDWTVVVDGSLPPVTLRAIANLAELRPAIGIVAVGPLEPNHEVLIALASGINSYVPAGSPPEKVADAVDALCAGKVTLPRMVSLPLVAHLHNDELGITVESSDGCATTLTHREWQVLVLARQAYTTAEIGERLVVSKPTVRTHLAALARKLDLPGRAALARPATNRPEPNQRSKPVSGQLRSA